MSTTTSAKNELGSRRCEEDLCVPPLFFFPSSSSFFSPPSCPMDQNRPLSHCFPASPPCGGPPGGLKWWRWWWWGAGGAFTAKFYDPTAMLIPIREGSRQRTEDTVGGGTKSLCALEVLTYRAADHVVWLRWWEAEQFMSGNDATLLLSRSWPPVSGQREAAFTPNATTLRCSH